MKVRIINQIYAGIFSDDFFRENLENIINGELVKNWQTTNIIPTDEQIKLGFKFINNGWVDIRTAQEIAEITASKILKAETNNYLQRTKDGQEAYAKISAEFRLAKLAGVITEAAHGFIENTLIGVRNEILAGQWKSGLALLETLGSSAIGVDLYNRLHTQISDYVSQSY